MGPKVAHPYLLANLCQLLCTLLLILTVGAVEKVQATVTTALCFPYLRVLLKVIEIVEIEACAPHQSSSTLVRSTSTLVRSISTPDQSTTTPDQSTDTLVRSTDTLVRSTSTPDQSTTTADQSTSTPDQTTTTTDQSTCTPFN